nr:putative reverse transcriptase domain-containing protein [Tanacetum cinerariifolium]
SYIGRESRLTIFSCSKVQEYLAKGHHVFLAQISTTREDDKPEGKQVKDVPIVQNFPKMFSEKLPGVIQNGKVAYKLELPQELSRVHHTFHVSNVKKCYSGESLVMPLEGVHINNTLQFVEEPVEIMGREIKRRKPSQVPLVKVR